jgi:hypothetical protein
MVSDLLRVPFAGHMLVPLPRGLDPLRVAAASDNLADALANRRPPAAPAPRRTRPRRRRGGAQSIGLYADGLAVAHNTDITLHLGISHPRAVLPELLAWISQHDFPAERVTTHLADFDSAPTAYATRTTKLVLHRPPSTVYMVLADQDGGFQGWHRRPFRVQRRLMATAATTRPTRACATPSSRRESG